MIKKIKKTEAIRWPPPHFPTGMAPQLYAPRPPTSASALLLHAGPPTAPQQHFHGLPRTQQGFSPFAIVSPVLPCPFPYELLLPPSQNKLLGSHSPTPAISQNVCSPLKQNSSRASRLTFSPVRLRSRGRRDLCRRHRPCLPDRTTCLSLSPWPAWSPFIRHPAPFPLLETRPLRE